MVGGAISRVIPHTTVVEPSLTSVEAGAVEIEPILYNKLSERWDDDSKGVRLTLINGGVTEGVSAVESASVWSYFLREKLFEIRAWMEFAEKGGSEGGGGGSWSRYGHSLAEIGRKQGKELILLSVSTFFHSNRIESGGRRTRQRWRHGGRPIYRSTLVSLPFQRSFPIPQRNPLQRPRRNYCRTAAPLHSTHESGLRSTRRNALLSG